MILLTYYRKYFSLLNVIYIFIIFDPFINKTETYETSQQIFFIIS